MIIHNTIALPLFPPTEQRGNQAPFWFGVSENVFQLKLTCAGSHQVGGGELAPRGAKAKETCSLVLPLFLKRLRMTNVTNTLSLLEGQLLSIQYFHMEAVTVRASSQKSHLGLSTFFLTENYFPKLHLALGPLSDS